MANVNELVGKSECSGCGACVNSCPHGAITLLHDDEGFLSPVVDKGKCTDCSKCVVNCPYLYCRYDTSVDKINCYIAISKNEEERTKSSSGGIFSLLANYVLSKGGIVFGTTLNQDFLAATIEIDSANDLDKLRGSKYMQTDPSDTYNKIIKYLKDDLYVLYCSTPCQIAALNLIIHNRKVNRDKLITIDLMCHGGSSPLLFRKYLNEFYGPIEKIESYSFRDKSVFGWSTEANIYFKDGSEKHIKRDQDYWYKAFLPCVNVRTACGSCKYARIPRQGDFTLGDFWGVKKLSPKYDDGMGTSFVLLNSAKANQIFESLKQNLSLCKSIDLDTLIKFGQPINHSFKLHPVRDRFFELNRMGSYEKAFEYSVNRKYDVGIVGVWPGLNFGSALTYFSLYSFLEQNSISCLLIEPPGLDDQKKNENHSRRFIADRCHISAKLRVKDLKILNNYCDSFIVGSDQVWNYGISKKFGKFFYLNFVSRFKKKISIAASFGHDVDFAPQSERIAIANLLNNFDYISVREFEGREICSEVYGVNTQVEVILDPVFLNDSKFYHLISLDSSMNYSDYSLMYVLDLTDDFRKILLNSLKNHPEHKWIFLGDSGKRNNDAVSFCRTNGIEYVSDISISDFIYLIEHAKQVITDSYHGSCFSLIFKKPFLVFKNKRRGMSRINTLIKHFSLDNCVVSNENIHFNSEYTHNFDQELPRLLKISSDFILRAIYSDKLIPNPYQIWKYSYA